MSARIEDSLAEQIHLESVTTNNLKAIDVEFPLGQISVVTGVSGSGKSSLVFDTLYGEAYRRYVESLSSFARQYLKALPKPGVKTVRNLPPAIAVKQSKSGATNRSTVGTSTELADLLRVLYTHLSHIECPSCGKRVEKDTPESVARKTIEQFSGHRILIAAPLAAWGKVQAKELKAQLEAQGFSRLLLPQADRGAPQVVRLEEAKAADLKTAAVVVDRVKADEDSRMRIGEAAQLALRAGRGTAWSVAEDGRREYFSTALACASCGIDFVEPQSALFSFNHPLGACPKCQGFGSASEVDYDKVIPDKSKSLADQGVNCWNFGQFAEYYSWAKTSAKKMKFDCALPFEKYSAAQWQWLRRGDGTHAFDGIDGFFAYLDSKKYKAHYRIHAARFRKYETCPVCNGNRLNDKALACKLMGLDIAQLSNLSIEHVADWIDKLAKEYAPSLESSQGLESDGNESMGVREAVEEAQARLGYLEKIGVAYLSLSRSARTLSGGELQRINMARCLGSALTDTLFCLDEPSAGLHARDSRNLLEVVKELRDQGNTVVLVEHERTVIRGADHLIEIGPKAGHEGGFLVYAGPPKKMGREGFADLNDGRARGVEKAKFIELKGARTHNLKAIDIKIPVGAVTAVCGVSGSGKTSLVQHTLYPLIAQALGQPVDRLGSAPLADGIGPPALLKRHRQVLLVSQAALGRSSRSNIATYLGVMDEFRKILAAEALAKKLRLTPGSFSFNTPGGRCETCRGLGTVTEDLSFLGEMEIICPACSGRRFGEAVLSVEFRGKNLTDILAMTVGEARVFFFDRPTITRICDVVIEMGMGYLTLGQSTSSFSGGEAQRLKLVSLMRDVKDEGASVLIFDEPTTGLSDTDVANLLVQFKALADRGHTILIVEHHLDVLRAADWLIEVGPESAERGGDLVYQGPPAGIGRAERSLTAPFLIDDGQAAAKSWGTH